MPIYVIDKLKQKNDGNFKLVDAQDVEGLDSEISKKIQENSNQLRTELQQYTDRKIGEIDFSPYATKEELSTQLDSYVTTESLNVRLGDYVTNTNLTSTLGAYLKIENLESSVNPIIEAKNYITLEQVPEAKVKDVQNDEGTSLVNEQGLAIIPQYKLSETSEVYLTEGGHAPLNEYILSEISNGGSKSAVETIADTQIASYMTENLLSSEEATELYRQIKTELYPQV